MLAVQNRRRSSISDLPPEVKFARSPIRRCSACIEKPFTPSGRPMDLLGIPKSALRKRDSIKITDERDAPGIDRDYHSGSEASDHSDVEQDRNVSPKPWIDRARLLGGGSETFKKVLIEMDEDERKAKMPPVIMEPVPDVNDARRPSRATIRRRSSITALKKAIQLTKRKD